MLERVGTSSFSQSLINEYSRIQVRTQKTQAQISSGKIGDQFADTKDKAGVLASAKIKSAGVEAFTSATKEVLARLDLQDVHLRELSDVAARLRAAIGDALSTGHAPSLTEEVKNLFNETVGILNSKIDGKYIYGGSRSDQPPVNVATLADLVAAPTTASVFDNTTLQQSQRLDENETMETGVLASDAGTGLMQMFKDISAYDTGVNGPFGQNLTAVQVLSGDHGLERGLE